MRLVFRESWPGLCMLRARVCYRVNCVCIVHICPWDESSSGGSHRSHHTTRPFVFVALLFDSDPPSVCLSTAIKYFVHFPKHISCISKLLNRTFYKSILDDIDCEKYKWKRVNWMIRVVFLRWCNFVVTPAQSALQRSSSGVRVWRLISWGIGEAWGGILHLTSTGDLLL